MDKTRHKFTATDGFVLSLITGVVLATVVFNIVLGKDMGGAIFDGIGKCSEDIAAIRGGAVFARSWEIVSSQGFDPFFLLSLLLPGFADNIIMAGFFLKFGICAGIMYLFLNKHTGCSPFFAFILGEIYAFSSQVLFTAQFNPVMNLTLILPAFMCAMDSFLRKRGYIEFIKVSLVTALMGLCLLPGLLAGIPFALVITLFMCIALYEGFVKCMKAYAGSIPPVLLGLIVSNFALMPVIGRSDITFTFKEAYENARMNFRLYDVLAGTFALDSGSMSNINPPVLYIGLVTIVLIVLFIINAKIPFKLKFAFLLTGSLTYITCASSFMRWFTQPGGQNPVITSARLIGFTAICIFIAGISARNIRGLTDAAVYAAGLVPCAFVVLTGGSKSEVTKLPLVLIGTISGFIVWSLFIRSIRDGRASKAALICFTALSVGFIGFNTYKIVSANTISHDFTKAPFDLCSDDVKKSVIYDESDMSLSVFTESSDLKYLILSSDMSQITGSYIDMINGASRAALKDNIFEIQDLRLAAAENLTCPGLGCYTVYPGFNSVTFNCDVEADGDYYLCSEFDATVSIEQMSKTYELQDVYDGPFVHKLDNIAAMHGITLYINSNDMQTAGISLAKLLPGAAEELNQITYSAEGTGIRFSFDDIPGRSGGIKMIIFSIPYDEDLVVSINGRKCDKVSYAGLLAVSFPASADRPEYKVSIEKSVPGLTAGIVISIIGAALVLAIGIINKYNKEIVEKSNTEGKDDAQQEDN